MYGIDTNVLLRYLLQDDEIQSPIATNFITQVCSSSEPAFINNLVLAECVWVLQAGYGYSKGEIVEVLRILAGAKEVTFEDENVVTIAIGNYQRGSADFADYLLAQTNQIHSCTDTVTFDKKASKSPQFSLLM